MRYFINLTLKYLHFRPRTVNFGPYLRCWYRNAWQKNDVKMTLKRQNTSDVMHESRLTPPCKTTFSSPGRVHGNSGRVYKNTKSSRIYRLRLVILQTRHQMAVFTIKDSALDIAWQIPLHMHWNENRKQDKIKNTVGLRKHLNNKNFPANASSENLPVTYNFCFYGAREVTFHSLYHCVLSNYYVVLSNCYFDISN